MPNSKTTNQTAEQVAAQLKARLATQNKYAANTADKVRSAALQTKPGVRIGEPNPSGGGPIKRLPRPGGGKAPLPLPKPGPGGPYPGPGGPIPKPGGPVTSPTLPGGKTKPIKSKKVKNWRPQFTESVKEQAAENALRKRMLAAGKTHKDIQKAKMRRGFLSPAEKKFNQKTRNRMMRKGMTFRDAQTNLRQIKANSGVRGVPSRIGVPLNEFNRVKKKAGDVSAYKKATKAAREKKAAQT